MIESFTTQPLQAVPPAYVYDQHSDDADIQAMFGGFNSVAQEYLDWFNQTPLPLYTSPNISGPLLDYIGTQFYGIQRPNISNVSFQTIGALGTYPLGALAWGSAKTTTAGTVQLATDDIYKRLLTWYVYKGDGQQMSVTWIRKRIARFIYGINGTDIDISLMWTIGLSAIPQTQGGFYALATFGRWPFALAKQPILHKGIANLPSYPISGVLENLLSTGAIQLPFQITLTPNLGFYLNQTNLNQGAL